MFDSKHLRLTRAVIGALALCALFLEAGLVGFAQPSAPQFTIKLNQDHIVAGQPWQLICAVPGVATIINKTPDKGWLSVRLLDEQGNEVGTFDPVETLSSKQEKVPAWANTAASAKTKSPDENGVFASDDSAIRYIAPKRTWNNRILLPQTNAITKVGNYRLVVRARRFFVDGPNGLRTETPEEAQMPELRGRRLIKASKTFRVVVTAVGPEALKKRAEELREKIITEHGVNRSEAIYELLSWPSETAPQQWRALLNDPRNKSYSADALASGLSRVATPAAIDFLGELTWKTNKADARFYLAYFYQMGSPEVKKQVGNIYSMYGERLPTGPLEVH